MEFVSFFYIIDRTWMNRDELRSADLLHSEEFEKILNWT